MQMRTKRVITFVVPMALALGTSSSLFASATIPTNFNAYGTSVSGFQDFFTSDDLSTNYTEINGTTTGNNGNFSISGGTLLMGPASGSTDPNKLLYSGATYSGTQ